MNKSPGSGSPYTPEEVEAAKAKYLAALVAPHKFDFAEIRKLTAESSRQAAIEYAQTEHQDLTQAEITKLHIQGSEVLNGLFDKLEEMNKEDPIAMMSLVYALQCFPIILASAPPNQYFAATMQGNQEKISRALGMAVFAGIFGDLGKGMK